MFTLHSTPVTPAGYSRGRSIHAFRAYEGYEESNGQTLQSMMSSKAHWFSLAIVCLTISIVANPCTAERLRFDSLDKTRQEFGIYAGYGQKQGIFGPLGEPFNLDAVRVRYGKVLSPRKAIGIELGISEHELHGEDIFTVSTLAAYRRNFLVRGNTALGWNLGIGLAYFTDHVPEQGKRLNFTEQLGLTLQYATGEQSAFTVDYRFCHTSNAGLKKPNIGINTTLVSVGYTWYK